MELLVVQLIALFLLLTGTFVCGVFPIFCFRKISPDSQGGGSTNRITSFLIYFGGGVLFSTAMLHLLPEAREDFAKAEQRDQRQEAYFNASITNGADHQQTPDEAEHHSHGFALPEFIVLCGFFGTYLIEVILLALLERRESHEGQNQALRERFCSCSQRNIECSQTFKNGSGLPTLANSKRRRSATWAGQMTSSRRQDENSPHESPPDILQSSIISQPHPNYGTVVSEGTGRKIRVEGGITITTRAVATPSCLPDIPEVETQDSGERHLATLSVASLLTVAALSFHSVLEGIAVGFQQTNVATWTLLLAIALHKFVIAFVIGVEAVADGSKATMIVACMALFSSMTPAGMGIAMSIGPSVRQVPDLVIGVVNCVATGTLLYVTFFEIWGRKSKEGLCTHRRFFATFFGTAMMAALQYATTIF